MSFLTPELQNKAFELDSLNFEYLNGKEIEALSYRAPIIVDVESYPDFFFVGIQDYATGKYVKPIFDTPEKPCTWQDRQRLDYLVRNLTFCGFNFHGYDKAMIQLWLSCRYNLEELCEFSDAIIQQSIPAWKQEKELGFKFDNYWKTVDILSVCPVNRSGKNQYTSLKTYGARMNYPILQDLPFPPSTPLEDLKKKIITGKYCHVDCDVTRNLFKELRGQLALRHALGEKYNVDLMSSSDAQIAVEVVKKKLLDRGIKAQTIKHVPDFVQYRRASNIKFKSERLNQIVAELEAAKFELDAAGSPVWPKTLGVEVKKDKYEYPFFLDGAKYRLGMGGLHSSETSVRWDANEDYELAENDVASFYPFIVLLLRLYPESLGEAFLEVYDEIVKTRLSAKKRSGDMSLDQALRAAAKTDADTLKIVINGLFGKFGSISPVYAPNLLLTITISGQLYLLMLIERFVSNGIKVVSANTDGIVTYSPRSKRGLVRDIIKQWEAETGFETEETQYKTLCFRDVNNYIAVTTKDGDPNAKDVASRVGCKAKGVYSEKGSALNSRLSKNPERQIVNDALLLYLAKGVPIADTIKNCNEVSKFVTVRKVTGGAFFKRKYLGKVVRFYYAKGSDSSIRYLKTGDLVAGSEGCKPLMTMNEGEFPSDVDVERYIKLATEECYKNGILKKPHQVALC